MDVLAAGSKDVEGPPRLVETETRFVGAIELCTDFLGTSWHSRDRWMAKICVEGEQGRHHLVDEVKHGAEGIRFNR